MYFAINTVAGVVLSGGTHVSSHLYTSSVEAALDLLPSRDLFEYVLLQESVQRNIPVFGICRGMQMMNAYCGGSLRDVTGGETALLHREVREPGKVSDDLEDHVLTEKHDIHFVSQSRLVRPSLEAVYLVNSIHAQVLDRLGEGIVVEAIAGGGEAEIITHEQYPWLGVQFHPELTPHTGVYQEMWRLWFEMVS
jgi:putative glutamine amidotransferase